MRPLGVVQHSLIAVALEFHPPHIHATVLQKLAYSLGPSRRHVLGHARLHAGIHMALDLQQNSYKYMENQEEGGEEKNKHTQMG